MGAYRVKRFLVAPRTALRRRRDGGNDPIGRSLLEAQYYQPAMYRFIAATVANPALLVDADLDDQSVVVDAGAYLGEWSEQIGRRYGSRIFAFEPNPQPRNRAVGDIARLRRGRAPVRARRSGRRRRTVARRAGSLALP